MKELLSDFHKAILFESIPIIIIFIVLVLSIKYKYRHQFWDKQPVMRDNIIKLGQIGVTPNFNIIIKNSFHKILINKVSVDKVIPFLKENFADDYKIDHNYLRYIYEKPGAINVCMLDNGNIIGFIHSAPLKINYNNRDIDFQYADYLCVKKNYRKDAIASVIIASFLKNMKSNVQPVLFKKEFFKLPFKPLINTNYYVKDLTKLKPDNINNNVVELNVYNFYKTYKYLNSLLKRYKFYKLYTKQELFEIFLEKKLMKLYIVKNISGFETIVIGKKNIYTIYNKIYNCFEIDYIIGELRYSKELYLNIANFLKNDGYNYISIPKIGGNSIFIEENNFIRGLKLYYYTYNYNIADLNLNDFCFNIN